jgi:uncharacterized protein
MRHRIGLISDTHGLLRPEAVAALGGAELILHAGDIGDPAILQALERIAPVTAVRGNNDAGHWATPIPEQAVLTVDGVAILVVHDERASVDRVARSAAAVVVAGHSHRPAVRQVGDRLHVNPGSAGPRRFSLPVSVAWLWVEGGVATAQIVELAVPRRR